MDFFIAPALAQAAGTASPGSAFSPFIMMGVVALLMYFMMIRPQMKRAKEQKKLLTELTKGDEVVTSSGQVGKISKIGDQYLSLEIADGVITHVQKQSVQTLLPKGTIKGL